MYNDDKLIYERYLSEAELDAKADEEPHDEKDMGNPEEKKEVTIGYQILSHLDKLEHNTASELKPDVAERQKAVKAIMELANQLLEMHGAQHD